MGRRPAAEGVVVASVNVSVPEAFATPGWKALKDAQAPSASARAGVRVAGGGAIPPVLVEPGLRALRRERLRAGPLHDDVPGK